MDVLSKNDEILVFGADEKVLYIPTEIPFTVEPLSLSFGSSYGTQSVEIVSVDGDWTVTRGNSFHTWMSFRYTPSGFLYGSLSGTGPTTFYIYVSSNSGRARSTTAVVTQTVNGDTKTIEVSQASL